MHFGRCFCAVAGSPSASKKLQLVSPLMEVKREPDNESPVTTIDDNSNSSLNGFAPIGSAMQSTDIASSNIGESPRKRERKQKFEGSLSGNLYIYHKSLICILFISLDKNLADDTTPDVNLQSILMHGPSNLKEEEGDHISQERFISYQDDAISRPRPFVRNNKAHGHQIQSSSKLYRTGFPPSHYSAQHQRPSDSAINSTIL